MNKKQAEVVVAALKAVLSNRNLVTVAVRWTNEVEVRVRQKFIDAYINEYADGKCSVAVSDSYGVMAGAEEWHIDPGQRRFTAKTTNGLGAPIQFLWVVDEGDRGEIWQEMKDWQDKVWASERGEV